MMTCRLHAFLAAAMFFAHVPFTAPLPGEPVNVGSNLQLFVDDLLIDQLSGGARAQLNRPTPANVAMVTGKPWEGNAAHYRTVFEDDGVHKMYYLANHYAMGQVGPTRRSLGPLLAYAESTDGITWTRPNLGLVEVGGSKENNVVLSPTTLTIPNHRIMEMGVTVFRDTNPDASDDAQYKAVAIGRRDGDRANSGLLALKSADGFHWEPMADEPVITDGHFDSQNLAFHDAGIGKYRAYYRVFVRGLRSIKTATSEDFINWTEGTLLSYGDTPPQALYTNQVIPYLRAPDILVGFPMRYNDRQPGPALDALPGKEHRDARAERAPRYGTVLTDAAFMASRDGTTFTRYTDAFIRPSAGADSWVYGDNSMAWGILETESQRIPGRKELSFYVTEGYWTHESMKVRRHTLRLDGFVSIHAPFSGGELLTEPMIFAGEELVLNFDTSAAGTIKVAVLDSGGTPIPGFSLDECHEIFGDHIAYPVRWQGDPDLASLAGEPIRLHFTLSDADLYSFRFTE